MQSSFQAFLREIAGTGSGTTLDSLEAKIEDLDIRPRGENILSIEIDTSIGKLSALAKEQKQFELVNGVTLPVSDVGIHVRKVTRIAEQWGRKAQERLADKDCKSLLVKWCDELSKGFKQTAEQLGFKSRVSFGDAVRMLIGEKEAAVAMEAQICAEFRDYGQYFLTLADALVTDEVVRVEQPPEMTGSAGASGSYAVVARRAFADKISGKDKKKGSVEITLGPSPAGSKWFQPAAHLRVHDHLPFHASAIV